MFLKSLSQRLAGADGEGLLQLFLGVELGKMRPSPWGYIYPGANGDRQLVSIHLPVFTIYL
jgi:hypothetical protein